MSYQRFFLSFNRLHAPMLTIIVLFVLTLFSVGANAQASRDCGLDKQTDLTILIDSYFKPECNLQSAIRFSRLLHEALTAQDKVQYQTIINTINTAMVSERAKNTNAECEKRFCEREDRLVDLVISL